MFNRAVVKPAQEARKAPDGKPALEKQLFPSSSPHPTQDGNIVEQFKKAAAHSSGSSFGPSSFKRPLRPVEPLGPRSANISPPANGRSVSVHKRATIGKGFAALYNTEDSFKDAPAVIDLIDDDGLDAKRANKFSPVYIGEDDFSDDDDLLLDLERPSALPDLPPPRKTEEKRQPEPHPSSTSILSWSQSSPSHYVRPQRPQTTASQSSGSQKSIKRQSPDDDAPTPLPAAKKRVIPDRWKESRNVEGGNEQPFVDVSAIATPAPKPKKRLPWDATPGAVNRQQKQFKNQQKKLVAPQPPEVSLEETQESVASHAISKTSAISLSNEQRHVKSLVCEKNQSVFFTGPAGTGKSVLMRAIIQELKKKHARDPERVAVTASTGLAACNIGGMTLHSFSGIGLGKEDAQTLVKKIRRNPKAKNRWLRTKILVIDEISMVDGDLFDKLSQIGRVIRNNGRPWGGIQLVITGDFFQLPPVPDGQDKKRDVKFAFEAATWNTSIDHTIGLTEVFRQRDPVFAMMLNEMRLGQITEQTVRAFKGLSRDLKFDDGLEFTELFPTRQEVDRSNQTRLAALPGKIYRYDALDTGDPAIRDRLLQNMMAPKSLELKKGAQVMLIKNMDETLVNGSLGTVIGFMTESTFELNGISGEFDDSVVDNSLDSKVKKRLAMFSRELEGKPSGNQREYPLVQFHAVDGTPRILLCNSEPWKVELPTGEVQASREQLPLILAWALSIHKAQGQTLERVKVDLGKVFEKGQAYVALSRATCQEGLQVLRFEKHKVMAHPRVVQFYKQLYSAEVAVKKKKMITPSITSFASKGASAATAGRGKSFLDVDEEEAMAAAASYGY